MYGLQAEMSCAGATCEAPRAEQVVRPFAESAKQSAAQQRYDLGD